MSSERKAHETHVGPVLRALREGARMSQRGLAKAAGVDHTNLNRVEASQREISPELLVKVLGAIADRLHHRGDAA